MFAWIDKESTAFFRSSYCFYSRNVCVRLPEKYSSSSLIEAKEEAYALFINRLSPVGRSCICMSRKIAARGHRQYGCQVHSPQRNLYTQLCVDTVECILDVYLCFVCMIFITPAVPSSPLFQCFSALLLQPLLWLSASALFDTWR